MNHFIVTTFSDKGSILHSRVWDPIRPLGMGYPFSFILESVQDGVRIRDLHQEVAQTFSKTLLNSKELITFGPLRLKIHAVTLGNQHLGFSPLYLPSVPVLDLGKKDSFQKLIGYSGIFLALFIGSTLVIPHSKPDKEELIPPQFAKLILKPSAPSSSSARQKAETETKAQASTVVQAFQSKQVQHSVRQLFKGGVLTLLTKSDLLSSSHSQAKLETLFKEQSHLKNRTAGMDLGAGKAIQVAQFGGSGSGTSGDVGYGKGEHSTVAGQGHGFVSLETADSVVEEGLTKDEVGKVIHDHLSEVRYCYESAILKNPEIQGKLMVEFAIHGKALAGSVKSAHVSSGTLGDGSVGDCIVKKLTQWKFPKPRGGVDVSVNYPFIFKTLGK